MTFPDRADSFRFPGCRSRIMHRLACLAALLLVSLINTNAFSQN